MDEIVLQRNGILVKRIEDYFGRTKTDSGFDSTITENLNMDVGVIVKLGSDLPIEWNGKIIYYTKGMGTKVVLKSMGRFELVSDDFRMIIRLDQDEKNY
jgi:hypothetical protein